MFALMHLEQNKHGETSFINLPEMKTNMHVVIDTPQCCITRSGFATLSIAHRLLLQDFAT